MQSHNFEEAIQKIVAADPRYQPDAYLFMQEAIHLTQKALGRQESESKHVGGKELLEGIRDHALDSFGPMAAEVLGDWGIRSCEDFGEIVFNLIQFNQATQSDTDRREDFKGGYDFHDAFSKPFLPTHKRGSTAKPSSITVLDKE